MTKCEREQKIGENNKLSSDSYAEAKGIVLAHLITRTDHPKLVWSDDNDSKRAERVSAVRAFESVARMGVENAFSCRQHPRYRAGISTHR